MDVSLLYPKCTIPARLRPGSLISRESASKLSSAPLKRPETSCLGWRTLQAHSVVLILYACSSIRRYWMLWINSGLVVLSVSRVGSIVLRDWCGSCGRLRHFT